MSTHPQSRDANHARYEEGTLQPSVRPDDHVLGLASAPVTLVEYGDFQCPYCGMAHPIVQALQRELGDSLRFVFRNFPLTEMHEHALHAAEAAESVDAQAGAAAYWTMHDILFERQSEWVHSPDESRFLDYARRAGGDVSVVERELADGTREARVKADFRSGVRSGVNGTPTFFVNGVRFDGNWTDPQELRSALERAAASPALPPP